MASTFAFENVFPSPSQPISGFPLDSPHSVDDVYSFAIGSEEPSYPAKALQLAPWQSFNPSSLLHQQSLLSSDFSSNISSFVSPVDDISPQISESSDGYFTSVPPQTYDQRTVSAQTFASSPQNSSPSPSEPQQFNNEYEASTSPSTIPHLTQTSKSIDASSHHARRSSRALRSEDQSTRLNHNSIEKRYRKNLNSQIESLWEVLPSSAAKERPCKASVIASARNRVLHLEDENKRVQREMEELNEKSRGYADLLSRRGGQLDGFYRGARGGLIFYVLFSEI